MAKMAKATFGAGCFWSVELIYQRTVGVLSTEVGYCNGKVDNPTYDAVCSGRTGHAEVVQVTYDPAQVGFEKLLDVFWNKHDPTTPNRQGNDSGSQYRSGIYCHTPEQEEVARKSIVQYQPKFKSPIVTEVASISKYTRAEEYHQQYLAKGGRNGNGQSAAKDCKDPIRCYG
jgi:peptide-methionine (S)-S-oxide reductase